MSEHGQDFDGMRNFLEKYLFIYDDTIELQMFQGCQNWSWISQGVLGSNFIALPGNQDGWAIQLYDRNRITCTRIIHASCRSIGK